jgi:hypothetical protein
VRFEPTVPSLYGVMEILRRSYSSDVLGRLVRAQVTFDKLKVELVAVTAA